MNTDARRKASAAFHAKRTADGYRKVTLWLHEDTREELDRLAKVYDCSKDRAASIAIDHHSDAARAREVKKAEAEMVTKPPPKPPKPVAKHTPEAVLKQAEPAAAKGFTPRADTYQAWMKPAPKRPKR